MENYRGYQIKFDESRNEFIFHRGGLNYSEKSQYDVINKINLLEGARQSYILDEYILWKYDSEKRHLNRLIQIYGLECVIWDFKLQNWVSIKPENIDIKYVFPLSELIDGYPTITKLATIQPK